MTRPTAEATFVGQRRREIADAWAEFFPELTVRTVGATVDLVSVAFPLVYGVTLEPIAGLTMYRPIASVDVLGRGAGHLAMLGLVQAQRVGGGPITLSVRHHPSGVADAARLLREQFWLPFNRTLTLDLVLHNLQRHIAARPGVPRSTQHELQLLVTLSAMCGRRDRVDQSLAFARAWDKPDEHWLMGGGERWVDEMASVAADPAGMVLRAEVDLVALGLDQAPRTELC